MRGTTNQNRRGNTVDRARRRQWLLAQFGDGVEAPCCFCGKTLNDRTITVDRIVPGSQGGRYVRGNIRPACGTCNSSDGATRCKRKRNLGGDPLPLEAVS